MEVPVSPLAREHDRGRDVGGVTKHPRGAGAGTAAQPVTSSHMTAVATRAAGETAKQGVDRGVLAVFAGLLLGSLVASLNMTLVAPALPTIVAELGGLADYSWVPISAMLASTIVVPVAGKLSDVYGRKPLYMTGIIVFAVGSALSGLAPNFWFLVFARFVQGAGMGFIMPLSQAIIGDIISPRERGKYQGMMGASSGLRPSSVRRPAVSSQSTSRGAGCSS